MKPEDQNIAIAEICGWKLRWQNRGGGPLFEVRPEGHCWQVWCGDTDTYSFEPQYPPDYVNDLNAMHDAEKVLKPLQWVTYGKHLQGLVDRTETWQIHASAGQRAEAFLKTMKLYKEEFENSP